MQPKFKAGGNIAIKVPAHEFDRTVHFYKGILGLEEMDGPSADHPDSVVFAFGDKKLWIDKVAGISHAEIWLEIETADLDAASAYFTKQGCTRRDEIEPLPEGFRGFWISSPSNIIHLVTAVSAE